MKKKFYFLSNCSNYYLFLSKKNLENKLMKYKTVPTYYVLDFMWDIWCSSKLIQAFTPHYSSCLGLFPGKHILIYQFCFKSNGWILFHLIFVFTYYRYYTLLTSVVGIANFQFWTRYTYCVVKGEGVMVEGLLNFD